MVTNLTLRLPVWYICSVANSKFAVLLIFRAFLVRSPDFLEMVLPNVQVHHIPTYPPFLRMYLRQSLLKLYISHLTYNHDNLYVFWKVTMFTLPLITCFKFISLYNIPLGPITLQSEMNDSDQRENVELYCISKIILTVEIETSLQESAFLKVKTVCPDIIRAKVTT